MRIAVTRLLLLVASLLASLPVHAAPPPEPFFNISTYKSFAPGEKPKLHLYTRNVSLLEFRVYGIRDPDKFVAELPGMHSFGERRPQSPVEQIDEKTWLERFHDWKRGLWSSIKSFLRTQLSHEARQALTRHPSNAIRRSRILNTAQFAQIPLLNDKQLVARWSQELPATFVTDNQVLPIDSLPAGMYLIEATDGHQKAYTILLVSQTALITRTVSGSVLAYAVDRKSGAPRHRRDRILRPVRPAASPRHHRRRRGCRIQSRRPRKACLRHPGHSRPHRREL